MIHLFNKYWIFEIGFQKNNLSVYLKLQNLILIKLQQLSLEVSYLLQLYLLLLKNHL